MTHTLRAVGLLSCLTLLCSCEGSTSGGETPPAAGATTGSTSAPVATGVIRGVIELDPARAVTLADYRCIFLIGWRGERKGTAQLVRKLPAATLPVKFELDARDLMGPGTLSGEWTLAARLDADGDAAPARGDLEGVFTGATADGPTARLVLARTLTAEDERSLQIDGAGHGADPGFGQGLGLGGGSGALPAGHPPLNQPALPAGHPPTGGQAAAGAAAPTAGASTTAADGKPKAAVPGDPRIRGTLRLADEFAALDGTRTLFVMLKDSTADRGMPRAVLKVEQPRFPLAFDIGIEHVPLQVENKADLLTGQLYLTARLDGDGSIMKSAGDIELAAPLPVTADGAAVLVVLDTERKP